jgi:hypothetical protein
MGSNAPLLRSDGKTVQAAALQAIVGNDPFVVVLVRARAVPANLPAKTGQKEPITSQKSRPSHKRVDWKWDDYPNVIYGYR